eukprot:CAMPEP_0196819856 /NCGR_PEP_ID=MMETSP1362-20130617/72574_1 /TAXON_ID=163516 /ORGANISM="Leptocylindrus danicus, Strain CCMP1856" /LENGTH=323 /DNA_ID=CAMNT_0042198499 /DNA_START=118 /DNA_END=1086 /DNA_ORIENTATION=+
MKFSDILSRQAGFALTSFLLGAWAFYKVNSVSGPAFEPIIAACSNPDYKESMEDFVSKTGYHAYEPLVGLKVFEILVCLITQFLLELRDTYPAGVLTWTGVILAAQPAGVLGIVEAGRNGARGYIRYSVLHGLLAQLFGISVMFPLLWVPAYVLGRGSGPISTPRATAIIPMILPGTILTVAVFSLNTDSYGWTICAGMLGGPIIAMSPVFMWTDKPPTAATVTKEVVHGSISSVQKAYTIVTILGTIVWIIAVYFVYDAYGSAGSFGAIIVKLWSDVWVDANASVAFMTIDTIVLYIAVLLAIAYQNFEKVAKALVLTPFMG